MPCVTPCTRRNKFATLSGGIPGPCRTRRRSPRGAGLRYTLDGGLQDALGQSGWAFTGTWAGFARFQQPSVRPPVWLQNGPRGATATQVSLSDDGTEVDRVTTTATVMLVRSESNLPGWQATVTPTGGGRSRSLPIRSVELIQGVDLPAGSWTVTFSYRAPGLDLGLALSLLGTGAVLMVAGVWATRRGRARRTGVRLGPAIARDGP